MQFPLSMVFFDVVNVCNLKCPFCWTDWSKVRKGIIVKDDVLKKVFQLAPYLPDASLALSCRAEPTLHPKLAEILDGLPNQYRSKFFMTSNLAFRMSDRLMDAIALSGISHLNISCDAMEEGTFSHLRHGGKLSAFLDNARRLDAAMRRADPARRPKIRIVTMGFKSNFDEIPRIIEFGKSVGAYWHEVRFVFDMPHVPDEFTREEILDEAQWDSLVELAKSESTLHVFRPAADYKYSFQRGDADLAAPIAMSLGAGSHYTAADGEAGPRQQTAQSFISEQRRTVNGTVMPFAMATTPLTLHVEPDGSTIVGEWHNQLFDINLLSIPNPGLFFSALVSGFVPPVSLEITDSSEIATLDLCPGIHGDVTVAVNTSNRDALWEGELRLEVYVPGEVPAFRVAYCNDADGEFPDVVEKYCNLKPGHQILSVRVADCVVLRGAPARDNITRVHIGGFVQQGASPIFIAAKLLHADDAQPLSLVTA